MKFSMFQLPLSSDPRHDGRVLDEALRQAALAEELGFDGVWLAEHHFTGESAFADPVVFATAIAQRTERVEIGFAVLQLALHHPIRLAVQLALLDHLSQGRLRVGVGRGSAINEWEYAGFGLSLEEGRARFAEALELLITAWTSTDLAYQGDYFRVFVPAIRPAPYQQPHPPVYRAALSPESTAEIGRQGWPILFPRLDGPTIRHRLAVYTTALREAGCAEPLIADRLAEAGFLKNVYVAPTDEEAWDEVRRPIERQLAALTASRRRYNRSAASLPASGEGAGPLDPPAIATGTPVSATMQRGLIVGSPATVREQLASLRQDGVNHLMAAMSWGEMPPARVERSMRLFASEVMPALRGQAATSLGD